MKKPNKEAVAFSRHINDWLTVYVPTVQSSSAHTVKNHHDALSLFLHFITQVKGLDARTFSFKLLERQVIEEWILWLKNDRKNSSETCNNRLASIRAFIKYLSEKDVSLTYLACESAQIPRQRSVRKKVEGLSKNAVKALLNAPDTNTSTGRRDLVFLILMYGTAARIDEVLSMKIQHLHLHASKPYATIIGKGNKVRTLYLLPKVVAHLEKYIVEFHPTQLDPDSYVFYSRIKGTSTKMTQPAIAKRLHKYAAVANGECPEVPLNLHAHQIRHAKASHWLEDGMNIVQISFLLGHADVKTTMVYLDITTEQEEKALATIENEKDREIPKKWKKAPQSFAELCGLCVIK